MASKLYNGNVDIVITKKNEVALKRNPQGKYSAENVEACHARILEVSKERKLPVKEYTVFAPPLKKGTKTVTLMLAGKFGQPYIGVLEDKGGPSGGKKLEVVS